MFDGTNITEYFDIGFKESTRNGGSYKTEGKVKASSRGRQENIEYVMKDGTGGWSEE